MIAMNNPVNQIGYYNHSHNKYKKLLFTRFSFYKQLMEIKIRFLSALSGS